MNNAVALAIGTLLAVGALAFVLYPLFFNVPRRAAPKRAETRSADDSAIRALREIEFDRATGKLSDTDYAELRRDYGERAVREMRATDSAAAAAATTPAAASPSASAPEASDPVEARVRALRLAHRECRTCGVRPESDAIYCSTCGSYLDARCGSCGADVPETGAGFCSRCGAGLAAAV